jgi:hypothetical protein
LTVSKPWEAEDGWKWHVHCEFVCSLVCCARPLSCSSERRDRLTWRLRSLGSRRWKCYELCEFVCTLLVVVVEASEKEWCAEARM